MDDDLDEFLKLVNAGAGERFWICNRENWAGGHVDCNCPFVLTNNENLQATTTNLPDCSIVRRKCGLCKRSFTLCDCGEGMTLANNQEKICVWFLPKFGPFRCHKIGKNKNED